MSLSVIQTLAKLVVVITLLICGRQVPAAGIDAKEFASASNCPPSFEKMANNTCELRTVYQFYDSLGDHGIGHLQTSLPKERDGFSPEQIDLGRYLFFDPLSSSDGTLSCASCHQPDKGFADGKALNIGINGALATRSAPALWNVAFLKRFLGCPHLNARRASCRSTV
jgi:cytochrome c peroxidase